MRARYFYLWLLDGVFQNQQGCKIQSVTNAIYTFLAAGILKRVEATIFALNPDYFAKGAWRVIREQRKAFQSITTYYPNGAKKTMTQIVETSEEPSPIDENIAKSEPQNLLD